MTLPTFKKNWHISPNNALAAQADVITTNRAALLNLINALTGAGSYKLNGDEGAGTFDWYDTDGNVVTSPSNFATIRYTSDGTAVSSLGQNLLTDPSDFIWAANTVAHTWAIIDFPEIEIEVMLACRNTSPQGATLYIAASNYGVTGNRFVPTTHLADPTASGSYDVLTVGNWGGAFTVNAAIKIHVWKTSDGEAFEIQMANGGEVNTSFRVERPLVYNSTGWPHAAVVSWKSAAAGTSVITVANYHTAASFTTYASGQAVSVSLAMPYSQGTAAVSLATAPNALSGQWDMYPQWVSKSVAPVQGFHGELNDVWWAPLALQTTNISGAEPSEDPPVPAGRLACVGDMWRPWVPGISFLAA